MTSTLPDFTFETAPELPGSERVSRYGISAVRRLVHRLWDLTIEGLDNVPDEGPAILCPNHLSFCDSVFVPVSLRRRVWAIGKGEYMDDWKTKHLFPAMGMIPVDRTGRSVAWSLGIAQERLEAGELIGIFPEGSRSRSGLLHRGHVGAAHLALRTGAPIIPVGIIGSAAAMPVGNKLPVHKGRIIIRIGSPIGLGEYLGRPRTGAAKEALTRAVMTEIAALSGQAVVDEYLPIAA